MDRLVVSGWADGEADDRYWAAVTVTNGRGCFCGDQGVHEAYGGGSLVWQVSCRCDTETQEFGRGLLLLSGAGFSDGCGSGRGQGE